jgi:hypothetical protein
MGFFFFYGIFFFLPYNIILSGNYGVESSPIRKPTSNGLDIRFEFLNPSIRKLNPIIKCIFESCCRIHFTFVELM